jgi:tetratricopeptide (TPR) repeat protein
VDPEGRWIGARGRLTRTREIPPRWYGCCVALGAMTVRSSLKWTVTLLLTAAWAVATGLPSGAQPPGSEPIATGTLPFADSTQSEHLFDQSITVPELFEKAREAFGMDKFDLAEAFYREILIRQRSNVQAMLELSNVYERSGRLEYARGLLARSAKLEPGNEAIASRLSSVENILSAVLSEEVDSLIASKQYELALPKLSIHLGIEPDNPELYYKRALCYRHLGRPDAALSSVDKALRLDQQDRYYKLRAEILENLKTTEAREMIAEAKKLIQSNDPHDRSRALEILGEILQSDPDNAWARSEFLRLSEAGDGSAHADTSRAGDGGVRSTMDSVASFLSTAARTIAGLVARHLGAILLLVAVVIVFRSPLTRIITNALAPRPLLSGQFPRFSLTEILVMLNSESHTGVLHVKGESRRGKIYIESGEPCHCVVGKLEGTGALHHLLSTTRAGHFEFAEGSIPMNRTIDTPLTVVLLEQAAGGPGRSKHGSKGARQKKSKSRMKELLENKTRR